MVILGVGVAGPLERGNGAVAVAEPVANGAERKPSRGEARHDFDGLRQNIRRAGKVAARRRDRAPTCSAGRR